MLVESLAVRYRPKKIQHLIGQEHVQVILNGMRDKKQFPSSFLITGQYGSGKTTTARILTYLVNCESQTLCGKCASCKTLDHPDYIYHNAGKDGKIDDIRSLIKSSSVAPLFRYRVVVIDEAHQLTGASEKALLVPVEEPTKSTIWVLCTSEGEKINPAMRSRCCQLPIKQISPKDIAKRLLFISRKELDVDYDLKPVLFQIAQASEGSMRQAISTLENLIYSIASGKNPEDIEDIVESFSGSNDATDIDTATAQVLAAAVHLDLKTALKYIQLCEARVAMSKLRYLIDFLIRKKTGNVQFTPYSGKVFSSVIVDMKGDKRNILSVPALIALQCKLTDAEVKMNTANIDANIILQCSVAEFILDYRGSE